MRTLIRALPLALAAALLMLVAIACDSGGGDQTKSGGGGGLVSAAPLDVLTASAESFQQEVESLQAEMEFSIATGGFAVDANADIAFQTPDQMHMTMDLTGLGTFEMLLLGSEVYMNVPPQGWIVISLDEAGLEELGVDVETFQDLLVDHSLVDYEALIEGLGADGVEDLGEETLEGSTYRRYRATLDFGDLVAAFSDAFGATSDLNLGEVTGPLTFDVWLDPETFLPYRLAANGEFTFGADEMVFDATMRFFGYNEPVEIPEAPADAVPFALAGGP